MTRISLDNINCWEDFKSYAEGMPNTKSMGDAFEHLTYLYFKISPKYSFYDEVYKMSEVPNKDLELLKIPQQDLGIDLIAKVGDEYHPIQCKYHTNKNRSVTFNEVSTFLTQLESNPNFNMGYIASTADTTSSNYDKLNTKQVQKLLNNTWLGLDRDFFDKAREFEKSNAYSPDPYYPREHQTKAINNAYTHFIKEKNNRGKLIFPCGAGKSLTGFWMMEKLNAKSTLVAVPSLSLIKQTLDVYLKEVVARNLKVKWLCICSDEGIGKNDDILFRTSEIGVPCTTDKAYIKEWLKTNEKENIIIFTTYQSGRLIAEISKSLKYTFDLGVYDEAHKTVGKNESLFSYLLFEENISIKHRIFMTATERFYRGVRDDVLTMDDTDDYGDVFSHMSFKEAIDKGLLTDYKIITIEVKKEEIAGFIKDNNLVQMNAKWEKESEARSLASMIALRKAMKAFPIKNAVSFHSSIERAVRNKEVQKHITDTYNYKPIETYHVSGKLPTSKRETIVNEFANSERALITNSRCLTEGVDVPNIDCIVFADPRKSKVDIVQALGRALRKKDGKDFGYVVLPVIYDHTSHEIDNENFQEILNIVRGLAANDERIIEEFKDKSQNSGRVTGAREEIFRIDPALLEESELVGNLSIKLWDKLSRFNWIPFEEAREIVRSFKLNSYEDYKEVHKNYEFPNNIPLDPRRVYNTEGWISVKDWLGYKRLTNNEKNEIWLSYKEAKTSVKRLIKVHKITSARKWEQASLKGIIPSNVPKRPNRVYKNNGWINWGDWLGTGKIADGHQKFLSYNDAKKYLKKYNIGEGYKGWKKFKNSKQFPLNKIPKAPNLYYKNSGWVDIFDFLSKKRLVRSKNTVYWSYEKAMKWNVLQNQKLGIKTKVEWLNHYKSNDLDQSVPKDPSRFYKNKGWLGWRHWNGSSKKVVKDGQVVWRSYQSTIKVARSLKIKNLKQWRDERHLLPDDVPKSPWSVYEEWTNWNDFLGTKPLTRNREFLSFEEAKKFVRRKNFQTTEEWNSFKNSAKYPDFLPKAPNQKYKNERWRGLKSFLGIE